MLPLNEAILLMEGVAEALARLHQQGIRHLNLKPGNVLIGDEGQVVLTDVGLAPETLKDFPDQILDPANYQCVLPSYY